MKGTTITFNFCALTFQDLTVSYYLALLVQLIGPEGLEDKTREANCLLQSDVTLKGVHLLKLILFALLKMLKENILL